MLTALRSFRRPARMMRRHAGALLIGVLAVAAFSVCKLWMVRIFGSTIDALPRPPATDGPAPPTVPGASLADATLADAALALCILVLLEATFRYFARRLIIDSSRHIEARLKRELMGHIGRLPLAWYDRAQTGDLLSRMTQDVEMVRFLIGPTILYGSQALVMVPGCIWMMSQLSGTVTLTIAGVFLALLVAMAILMPRLQKHSRAVQEDIADISQHAQESFGGVRLLLHFAKQRVFEARFAALGEKYVHDNMRMTRLRALVHLFVHFCTDIVVLCVLAFGASEVIAGRLSTGDMFQFLILMGFLVWPLIALGWIIGTVPRSRSAADRIEAVLTADTESSAGKPVSLRGDLEVRNLTFHYAGEARPALDDVSFTLSAGQKLGLIGPVGAGKSTLLHLILRLYDPPPGTIFIDGHDVLDLALPDLRQLFAFAPQEPFLFSDTVADNVRFGRGTEAPDTAVHEAVTAAALDQDVSALEEGLDTVVGERGVTLSGGQKQRVALARALIAERPAVMLDDTLSAVDHRTAVRILDHLRTTSADRTLLIATHRLSAIADTDMILLLRDGKVVERGSHRDLLARDGDYANAWHLQREERALGGDA